ncbi:MAG: hypothetical protein CMP20_04870 [Rickettsiales bacterium]|nr:hypothetical protein [Rickettsiales bacterium]
MLLRSLGEEATLSIISLISNAILEDFTTKDLVITFAAFALYNVVRIAGLNTQGQVIAKAWELFGNVTVGVVTQYIIIEAQKAVDSSFVDAESIVLGFSLVNAALVIEEFGLFAEPRIIEIVTFSLGIYYSGLLLRVIESSKGYWSNSVVVITLFASYAWLHYHRKLHQMIFADGEHPYVERVFGVVTRTAKFVLVRWVVNIYEVSVFPEMYHLLLWLPHLGGIAVIAAFVEGFDTEDVVTVKAFLESFALFLSSVFFRRYSGRLLPNTIFALLFAVVWYILRSIMRLSIFQLANKTFWWRWLDYTLGIAARIASFLAIQSIIPTANDSIGHSNNTVERLLLYFLVIMIASVLLWDDI